MCSLQSRILLAHSGDVTLVGATFVCGWNAESMSPKTLFTFILPAFLSLLHFRVSITSRRRVKSVETNYRRRRRAGLTSSFHPSWISITYIELSRANMKRKWEKDEKRDLTPFLRLDCHHSLEWSRDRLSIRASSSLSSWWKLYNFPFHGPSSQMKDDTTQSQQRNSIHTSCSSETDDIEWK